ncbi:MAG: S1C family serine protease, partial [Candidatus Zixiibacteriota bacterium]
MRSSSIRKVVMARFIPAMCGLLLSATAANSQSFDFAKIQSQVSAYTVIVEMQIEVSFGINSSDHEERYLGTIVTGDGLVIFDGSDLASDNLFSSFSGVTVKTTPTKVGVTTLDGKHYDAEYLGFDRFTKVGFLKVAGGNKELLAPIKFNKQHQFKVGDWLALYMLMPEFVSPPLAADIGMVSSLIASPEPFPLTVGFNASQITSVLYNSTYEPVGILGNLMDPTSGSSDAGGMMDSFGDVGMPLLGVISADRIAQLIATPPTKGEIERGWLGISLQALTKDIADFWHLSLARGIIVNEVIKNSPADIGGLKVGDIIYQVNGQPVDVDREEKVAGFQRM